jgi:hypothetical protein
MQYITKVLIGLSALAFLFAVIGTLFDFQVMGVASEAFSRACTNLALIAIGYSICFKEQ